MSNRSCQVCPMRAAGYQLDYFDHGSNVHLGHFYVRYTSPESKSFSSWAQHMCAQCKYDGTLIARLTFSSQQLNIDTSQKKVATDLNNNASS